MLLLQAALTVWIVALTLRAHGLGGRPLLLLGVIAALSVAHHPALADRDPAHRHFRGLGVLALYLLLLRGDALRRCERVGLIVLIARRRRHPQRHARRAAGAASPPAVVLLPDRPPAHAARRPRPRPAGARARRRAWCSRADYVVAKRLAWTPGGFALSFGRMLQDGIVKKYLDEHCPDPALQLCAYKDQLPDDADVWFWGSALFDRLGRFAGLGEEMETDRARQPARLSGSAGRDRGRSPPPSS